MTTTTVKKSSAKPTPAPRPVVEKVERKPKATKKAAPKAAAKRGPKCVGCGSQDDVQKFTVAGTDTRNFCGECRTKLGG